MAALTSQTANVFPAQLRESIFNAYDHLIWIYCSSSAAFTQASINFSIFLQGGLIFVHPSEIYYKITIILLRARAPSLHVSVSIQNGANIAL